MTKRYIVALAAVALLAAGCGESLYDKPAAAGMDVPKYWACDDFFAGVQVVSETDRQAKILFAQGVNEWAQLAGQQFEKAGNGLTAAATDIPSNWQYATDKFATTCRDNGWKS